MENSLSPVPSSTSNRDYLYTKAMISTSALPWHFPSLAPFYLPSHPYPRLNKDSLTLSLLHILSL